MSPRRGATRKVTEREALSYFRKAQEFHQTMIEAYQQKRWNSAGLAAVHCVISSTDALLGKVAHLRSSGADHFQAVTLLRQQIQHDRTSMQADRLARILRQKSLIEYESGEFPEREAESIIRDAGRYWEWVQSFFVG